MSSCRLELKELVNALDKLSAGEVRYLCTTLGVEQTILDNIDSDHHRDSINRIPKYLQAWLDGDEEPSWAPIVEALKSKTLNKIVLAQKVAEKFCPTFASACGEAGGSARFSVASETSEYHTPPSSLEDDEIIPAPPPYELPDFRPEFRGDDLLSKGEEVDLSTAEKVSGYEEEFLSLVDSTRDYLLRKKRSKSDLYHFKAGLTKLPLLTKKKRLYFLDKRKRKILRADSMEEVFEILHPYWNYADYSLLDCIVEKNCDEKLRHRMKSYKDKLHGFEKETTLESFRMAVPEGPKVLPKYYSMLTATLEVDAAECTLFDVRKKFEKIVDRANLQPYILQHIKTGYTRTSLLVSFPRSVYKRVKQLLDDKFLQEIGVSPQSLSFKKKPTLRDLGLKFTSRYLEKRPVYVVRRWSNHRGSFQGSVADSRLRYSLPGSVAGRHSSFNGSVQSFLHEPTAVGRKPAFFVEECFTFTPL